MRPVREMDVIASPSQEKHYVSRVTAVNRIVIAASVGVFQVWLTSNKLWLVGQLLSKA